MSYKGPGTVGTGEDYVRVGEGKGRGTGEGNSRTNAQRHMSTINIFIMFMFKAIFMALFISHTLFFSTSQVQFNKQTVNECSCIFYAER